MQRSGLLRSHRSADGSKVAMVTLVGTSYAKVGCEYVQGVPGDECASCRWVSFCFNIPTGRRFRVISTRRIEHDCLIHSDGKVHAVEVESVGFDAGIGAQFAIPCSTISLEPLTCGQLECPNFPLCYQRDLQPGSKFVVARVNDDLVCMVGWKRKRAHLDYAP